MITRRLQISGSDRLRRNPHPGCYWTLPLADLSKGEHLMNSWQFSSTFLLFFSKTKDNVAELGEGFFQDLNRLKRRPADTLNRLIGLFIVIYN